MWMICVDLSQTHLDLLTTNLGVRSSNLFGRASNSLILIQNWCAIFALLTFEVFGAAPGQHRVQFGCDIFARCITSNPPFSFPRLLDRMVQVIFRCTVRRSGSRQKEEPAPSTPQTHQSGMPPSKS